MQQVSGLTSRFQREERTNDARSREIQWREKERYKEAEAGVGATMTGWWWWKFVPVAGGDDGDGSNSGNGGGRAAESCIHTYTHRPVAHDFGRTRFSFCLFHPFLSVCSVRICSFILVAVSLLLAAHCHSRETKSAERSCVTATPCYASIIQDACACSRERTRL